MNVLIIGSGGREHALAWKISQSPLCNNLYIAPGNAGTKNCGTNLNIKATDFEAIKNAALQNNIEMIVVGPEDPLVKGIYDFFINDESTRHITVIGPSAAAARLEGSKAFAKTFIQKNKIPTAAYREFDENNFKEGVDYISDHSLPIVLKADGLAAGKGVLICNTHEEALKEFELMMLHSKFGEAGKKVVIESFLKGIEMSVFVLTDGEHYCLLPEAKDYKRIGEKDSGLNTGGMGAISPVPFFDESLKQKVISKIVEPTIKGLKDDNLVYNGFIFLGLMVDNGEPYMIEYNCRMGDPETEAVIPRIKNDLLELFVAVKEKKLDQINIQSHSETTVTTVVVSGGYPGDYQTGIEISGLESATGSLIFHAGTIEKNNNIVTNGGRVLAITSMGQNIHAAAQNSRNTASEISFEGMYYRKDIGYEF